MRKRFQDFLRWLVFHYMPRFIFKRMTPCETIAFQLSCQEITFRQKLSIKFHLLFCHSCWVYNRQLDVLQKKLAAFYMRISKIPPEKEEHIDQLAESIIQKNCCKTHKHE